MRAFQLLVLSALLFSLVTADGRVKREDEKATEAEVATVEEPKPAHSHTPAKHYRAHTPRPKKYESVTPAPYVPESPPPPRPAPVQAPPHPYAIYVPGKPPGTCKYVVQCDDDTKPEAKEDFVPQTNAFLGGFAERPSMGLDVMEDAIEIFDEAEEEFENGEDEDDEEDEEEEEEDETSDFNVEESENEEASPDEDSKDENTTDEEATDDEKVDEDSAAKDTTADEGSSK